MYSIHNEEKSVVAERFIITLKTKIYKFVTSISKNVNINRFDDIVSEYDNTYHIKIKIKSVDVKDNTYIDSIELHSMELRSNDKDTEFKVSDNVRISKYKNIFAKEYTPNWPEKYFVIKKVKNQFHGHTLLMISMMKKLLKQFMKKNYKRLNNKNIG